MDKVTMQTENLNDMLENSQDEVGEFSEDNSVISDEEIDKMIYGAQDGAGDKFAYDDELAQLRKQLDK